MQFNVACANIIKIYISWPGFLNCLKCPGFGFVFPLPYSQSSYIIYTCICIAWTILIDPIVSMISRLCTIPANYFSISSFSMHENNTKTKPFRNPGQDMSGEKGAYGHSNVSYYCFYCIPHAILKYYLKKSAVYSTQQALVCSSEHCQHFITAHKLCCTRLTDVPFTFFSVCRRSGNVTLDLVNSD